MVFWFSGTGNSLFVADYMAKAFNEELVSIPKHLNAPFFEIGEKEKIGMVFPVYTWGIPPIVEEFIKNLRLVHYSDQEVWCIITCGDNCAKTDLQIKAILKEKQVVCRHIYSVQMPNADIGFPGFNSDNEALCRKKIAKAAAVLPILKYAIEMDNPFDYYITGPSKHTKSEILHPLMCKLGVKDKKMFFTTNDCTGCGACVQFCPVGNIQMKANGRPEWLGHCTFCHSCINRCPNESIQFGLYTIGKRRYFFKTSYLPKEK